MITRLIRQLSLTVWIAALVATALATADNTLSRTEMMQATGDSAQAYRCQKTCEEYAGFTADCAYESQVGLICTRCDHQDMIDTLEHNPWCAKNYQKQGTDTQDCGDAVLNATCLAMGQCEGGSSSMVKCPTPKVVTDQAD